MKLVLYSGGQTRENRHLHRAVADLCGPGKRLRFTYIPFCSDNSEVFFKRIVRRYRSYGFHEFECLPVDRPVDPLQLKRALAGDVIYLAGGNTFYFLKHLKSSGLMPKLLRFVKGGGVLAGLSAGAIILTPNIHLASIPEFDADDNEVKLKNFQALALTHFEFSPHYSDSVSRNRSLLRYSKKTPHPIYACSDGGGIVVDGESFNLYGDSAVFYQGHKLKLPIRR